MLWSKIRRPGSGPLSLRLRLPALLTSFCAVLAALSVGAVPFTYQGRLVDGSSLGNGNYELTFRLFDSLSGGLQVGSSLVLTPVAVTNGLFTVELDFGGTAFSGASRWLELAARVSGAVDAPETLGPRQAINAVPYAMRALAGSTNAADLVSGILPDARLSANVPRLADLTALSNVLTGRISALEAALATISNQVKVLPPASIAAVSANPSDPALLGAGWAKFSSVPAAPWVNGSSASAPVGRSGHSAVWTGNSWMIWGGNVGSGILSGTGATYDPATDQWTAISELNSPVARQRHSAVWTGNQMLVWGGIGNAGVLTNGASFSPTTGNWSPLPFTGEPAARQRHVTVWTGALMLVWGGLNPAGLLNDGKGFDPDPLGQTWTSLPSSGAPEARSEAEGVWTGTKFVVWGGQGALGELGTGGMLPLTGGAIPGAWTAISSSGAPSPRLGHTMVWTGSKVLVWGGSQGGVPTNTGASFDPVANTWTALNMVNVPAARSGHVAVWNGAEMLVFGGLGASAPLATGGAYDPATDLWRPLSSSGNPVARKDAEATWTGTELMMFGGTSSGTPVASLQRLNPQPTWYFFRKP